VASREAGLVGQEHCIHCDNFRSTLCVYEVGLAMGVEYKRQYMYHVKNMRMNMDAIESKKQAFLMKYNAGCSKATAIGKAINASVQHNLLYSPSAAPKDKNDIRIYWATCLEEVGNEFKKEVSIPAYEDIVEQLKKRMNLKFGSLFDSGSRHGSLFRISHSQKSISVFIKHLWCMGLIEEPNICPVDRIILSATAAKKIKDVSWGCVDSLEDHRRKFKYITTEAANQKLSVARWELLNFTN
jgi:hypothetical protein